MIKIFDIRRPCRRPNPSAIHPLKTVPNTPPKGKIPF